MSVVTLQIGQCGNQIGCDFFSTLMLNLVKEGKHGSNEQENYFREVIYSVYITIVCICVSVAVYRHHYSTSG